MFQIAVAIPQRTGQQQGQGAGLKPLRLDDSVHLRVQAEHFAQPDHSGLVGSLLVFHEHVTELAAIGTDGVNEINGAAAVRGCQPVGGDERVQRAEGDFQWGAVAQKWLHGGKQRPEPFAMRKPCQRRQSGREGGGVFEDEQARRTEYVGMMLLDLVEICATVLRLRIEPQRLEIVRFAGETDQGRPGYLRITIAGALFQ